jgi:hypothetical protein
VVPFTCYLYFTGLAVILCQRIWLPLSFGMLGLRGFFSRQELDLDIGQSSRAYPGRQIYAMQVRLRTLEVVQAFFLRGFDRAGGFAFEGAAYEVAGA